jgi:hypothetical protein
MSYLIEIAAAAALIGVLVRCALAILSSLEGAFERRYDVNEPPVGGRHE